MESITLAFIVLTIGVFIARYIVKTQGADILCGVLCLCSMGITIGDGTIASDTLVLYLLPQITILFMTFIHTAFGRSKEVC